MKQQYVLRGTTPLMVASLTGHEPVARTLLSKGANLALVDGDGSSALHLSAEQGHLAVTKLLVKAAPIWTQSALTGQRRFTRLRSMGTRRLWEC